MNIYSNSHLNLNIPNSAASNQLLSQNAKSLRHLDISQSKFNTKSQTPKKNDKSLFLRNSQNAQIEASSSNTFQKRRQTD